MKNKNVMENENEKRTLITFVKTSVELPEQKEIGKWGLLHLGWLKRFRIARYHELLISGELNSYLYKVNEEAQERFESLIVDFAESYGLSEELKEKDQLKWVQLANYVANAAKEIVENFLRAVWHIAY